MKIFKYIAVAILAFISMPIIIMFLGIPLIALVSALGRADYNI